MRRTIAIFLGLTAGLSLLAPSAAVATGSRSALIIGIGSFQGRTRPNPGSAGDAYSFQRMLLGEGWRSDEITMLVDSQATAAAIRSALQRFSDSCGPGSKCIFHYSGHVQMLNPGSRSGFRGEALWPTDNSFIGADELAGYLRKLQGQVWIDIAGCEAAAFDRGLSSSNVLFTGSSHETEKSYENPVWKNSIWTGLLVEQAMLQKAGDSNHDGHTNLREAIDYATPRAAQLTARESAGAQHPYVSGGQGTQWFESGGAPASAAPTRSCLLGILCL